MSSILQRSVSSAAGERESYLINARDTVDGLSKEAIVSSGLSGRSTGSLPMFGGQNTYADYAAFKQWVYVCIQAIATRVAGQDIGVGRIDGAVANEQRRVRPGGKKRPSKDVLPKSLKGASANVEVLSDHPILDLFARPNSLQYKAQLITIALQNLFLTGEGYFLLDESEDGSRKNLWAIPTAWVTPLHDGELFSGYSLRIGNSVEPVIVPDGAMSRIYFPDPCNLKAALSPVKAIAASVRTDSHIQSSQEKMFDNGIFPRIALRAGGYPSPDGSGQTDRRAVLTASQRKQLNLTIRKLYAGVVNHGEPPILDGIIDDIIKLSSTPEEMNWMQSGEQVKARIFQAFFVNPIVVGEVTPSNKAQAVEAEKNFCNQVVNPIADMLSKAFTEFLGPQYSPDERLVVWVEECHPIDEDLRLRKWDTARKNGDVTGTEYRSEILGIATDDEVVTRSPVLNNPTTMGSIANIQQQVNTGRIAVDQAVALMVLSLQIDELEARLLIGSKGKLPDSDEQIDSSSVHPRVKSLPSSGLTRKAVKEISHDEYENAEKKLTSVGKKLIDEQVRFIADEIREMESKTAPTIVTKDASQEAKALLDLIFNSSVWVEKWIAVYRPAVGGLIIRGATTELATTLAVMEKSKAISQDIMAGVLDKLDDDVFSGLPDWLVDAAFEETDKIFEQDYWLKIPETTRDDVFRTIRVAITDGRSIADIADEIMNNHGDIYTAARARAIARTETGAALNAGHEVGIKRVEELTGVVTGKEWLSVLGTTTRKSHAEKDGEQVASAGGMFTLGGVEVPYPSHFSLPASERINCQCTVISTMIADNLA